MDGLDKLLELLYSGRWEKIADLAKVLGWPADRVGRVCAFLSETRLVEYRRQDESVKLDAELKKLLLEPDEPA